jgi:hypothetical protein
VRERSSLGRLDGVREVDEVPGELEALADARRQRPHAEGLGRVVAAGDEVDGGLLRRMLGRLVGLTREEAVVAPGGGLRHVARRAAGADGDALHELGPVGEDERHPPEPLLNSLREIAGREGISEPSSEAVAVREASFALDSELGAEERVVPDLGVRVKREVVRHEAQVGVEEGAQSLAHDRPDPPLVLLPEEPVVDENHLRAPLGRALEQLARGRDAAGDPAHFRRADDLEPHRPVVGVGGEIEVLVRPGDDLVSVRHRGHKRSHSVG